MFVLNKIVWGLANPTVALVALCLACACCRAGRFARIAKFGLWTGLALLWFWMTALPTRMLGLPLEREWLADGRVPAAEAFPQADAIVLLGGGMNGATNVSGYAEMEMSADRVWQAARLWRAGKAPRMFVTGEGNGLTTTGLLADFGVPADALTIVDDARNTEEEAKEVRRLMAGPARGARPRVLLVTSAWHARRAKLMFEKYAPELETVPAPADFEVTVMMSRGFRMRELLPNGATMAINEFLFHEWLGYWGYRLLR